MSNLISLTDADSRNLLQPFTLLRHVADLRIGIRTIREKWEQIISGIGQEGMAKDVQPREIPGNIIPGAWTDLQSIPDDIRSLDHRVLERPWQLTAFNAWAIRNDFEMITRERESQPLPDTVRTTNRGWIFVEKDATLEHCFINAEDGPVYIGKGALVMDGAMLRGPLAVCEGAVVKMGATIYGGTTIGPHCIVGGEVKNSILMDYANKSHHGYIGDSVIGSWCNLGAGTSSSNIKNTGGMVNVWDMHAGSFEPAGLKCGLLMGDFSRAAIHTAFNTGTVTGVCANVFGAGGLTPKYIRSFSWGADGVERYGIEKALKDIDTWMGFKGRALTEDLRDSLIKLHSNT